MSLRVVVNKPSISLFFLFFFASFCYVILLCDSKLHFIGILSVKVADDQIPPNGVFYFTIAISHKHDLERIKKSKNDEKEQEVEVETRSSARQGRMLAPLNIERKNFKQIK